MAQPVLSIVIPVYNAENYLRECLESIKTQSLCEIEVILVDDGSNDSSGTICDDFTRGSSVFRVIHTENSGAVCARLRGIAETQGTWLIFMDPDDFLPTGDALRQMVALIEESDVDILMFHGDVIGGSEATRDGILRWFNRDPGPLIGEDIIWQCYMEKAFAHNLILKIFRGDIVRRAAGHTAEIFSLVYAEDYYLFFCIAMFAKYFTSVPTPPLYAYRYGSGISTKERYLTLKEYFAEICSGYKALYKMKEVLLGRPWEKNANDILEKLDLDSAFRYCVRLLKVEEKDRICGLKMLFGQWPRLAIIKALALVYKNNEHTWSNIIDELFRLAVPETDPALINSIIGGVRYPVAVGNGFAEAPYVLQEGWHNTEPKHVWSKSDAKLLLPVPRDCDTATCVLKLFFWVFGAGPSRPVDVLFSSGEQGWAWSEKITATSGDAIGLNIPLTGANDLRSINISIPDATSPQLLNGSRDNRTLGIALQRIELIKL